MGFRHVIWDMGGTLVDTYPQVDAAIRDALNQALLSDDAAASLASDVGAVSGPVSIDEIAHLTRISIETAVESLAANYGVDRDILDRAYDQVKDGWKSEPAPVMAGACEVMATIADRGGLNLVVTHRDRESASTLVRELALPVDDMICAPDGFPRKPSPAMYELICERHGIAPEECLAVGDREIDIQAAHAAKIRAALLETPGIPVESEAEFHLTALDQLLPVLEN